MNIGLVDVDRTNFPNLALMKISAWHKAQGDNVEWADELFGNYDRVYASKVFNFTPDISLNYHCEVIKGGTGYDIHSQLPAEVDAMQPDYSIYPSIPADTAYGFLTRGCPNKCGWCVVPRKEGAVKPYMDIEQIATEGKRKVILMDNNILALTDYATEQLTKIIKLGLRIDFNQALDARLVTNHFARLLAQVKWISGIRFGCDTKAQIAHCERAIEMLRHYGFKAEVMLYTMLHGDINECLQRINHWRADKKITCNAQPYRDPNNPKAQPPQWQKDMAHWCNRRWLYRATEFKDFRPRKGFKCSEYL